MSKKLGSWHGTLVVAAGEPIGKPGGLDQTYPFIPHPLYYWLTGSRRPGGVLVYDQSEGWRHFVRPISDDERLWEGPAEEPVGLDVADLSGWLKEHAHRDVASVGAFLDGVSSDRDADGFARIACDAARRVKDDEELEILKRAVAATAAGFARARVLIRPGISERALRIELEAEFQRNGADGLGFETIVGTGSNAAVLHFEPGERTAAADEVVLIDAGASVQGYTADVTRTFAASGAFTTAQRDVYGVVLAAQAAAIDRCRVGVEWHDVHRAATRTVAEGLLGLGALRGQVDDLCESGAASLFFPHGVGHMVGLGVRDVGGHAPGRPVGRPCWGVRVRVDMPLEERFLMTAEPGIYFVPAILDDAGRREHYRDQVNWEVVDQLRVVGGVRIEDDILITADGPVIMTAAIPK